MEVVATIKVCDILRLYGIDFTKEIGRISVFSVAFFWVLSLKLLGLVSELFDR